MDRRLALALLVAGTSLLLTALVANLPPPVKTATQCEETDCFLPLGVAVLVLLAATGISWGFVIRDRTELWAPTATGAIVMLMGPFAIADAWIGGTYSLNAQYLLAAVGTGVALACVAALTRRLRRRKKGSPMPS